MLDGIDKAKADLSEQLKTAGFATGVIAIEVEGKKGVTAFVVGNSNLEEIGMQVYALRKLADKLSLTLMQEVGEDGFSKLMSELNSSSEVKVISDKQETRRGDEV